MNKRARLARACRRMARFGLWLRDAGVGLADGGRDVRAGARLRTVSADARRPVSTGRCRTRRRCGAVLRGAGRGRACRANRSRRGWRLALGAGVGGIWREATELCVCPGCSCRFSQRSAITGGRGGVARGQASTSACRASEAARSHGIARGQAGRWSSASRMSRCGVRAGFLARCGGCGRRKVRRVVYRHRCRPPQHALVRYRPVSGLAGGVPSCGAFPWRNHSGIGRIACLPLRGQRRIRTGFPFHPAAAGHLFTRSVCGRR